MATLRKSHPNTQQYIGVDDTTLESAAPTVIGGLLASAGYIWDTGTLAWIKSTGGGGGGGGGAVTIADGADTAEGLTTDSAVVSDASGTISGKLRGLVKIFASVWDSSVGRLYTSPKPEAFILDVASSTITYLGKAPVGTSTASAAWKVSRLTTASSGGITIEYAGGSAAYSNVWNSRAGFTYS